MDWELLLPCLSELVDVPYYSLTLCYVIIISTVIHDQVYNQCYRTLVKFYQLYTVHFKLVLYYSYHRLFTADMPFYAEFSKIMYWSSLWLVSKCWLLGQLVNELGLYSLGVEPVYLHA